MNRSRSLFLLLACAVACADVKAAQSRGPQLSVDRRVDMTTDQLLVCGWDVKARSMTCTDWEHYILMVQARTPEAEK